MQKPIITFNDAKTSLSEERKNLVKEILEVLTLAEKKEPLSTDAARDIFLENQSKALKKAQSLFNSLKESYMSQDNDEGNTSEETGTLAADPNVDMD